MKINTLIIFSDEFRQRNFLDWILSHTSGSLPPHRYLGDIEISEYFIRFAGIDTKTRKPGKLVIEKSSIEEVCYGYDKVFNVFQTRGLGMAWAPVRIRFINVINEVKVAYFITGYDRLSSANKDFYNFLIEWLS